MILRLVKIGFFSILLAGVSTPTYSQHQHKLDSIQELVRVKSGIDRYDPLTDLAIEYASNEDYDKAISFLRDAHAIAYHYGDTFKIIQSGRMMGQMFNRLNKHLESREILLKILPIAKRTPSSEKEITLISNNLGLAYTFKAEYDKALYYHFKSLELREKIDDKFGLTISLNNIGLVYYALNNFDKAIWYYKKALEIKRITVNSYDLDRLLINLSLCYVNKKEYDTALKYLDEGFNVCKDNCSTQIIIEGKLAEGEIAFGEDRLEDAKNSYIKSYQLSRDIGNIRFQLENLILLAKLCNRQKNFPMAASYLNRAEELGKESEYNLLKIQLYKYFSFLYNQTHDYKNAAKYQAKYITLRDSIYNEELTQNLMVVQAEYEQRENKARIESQTNVLALKEEIIERQNILEIAAAVAIVLLALLILALYRNNRQKKNINVILEQKVQERTRELEASYALIQKAYLDQNNFIEKTARDIKSPLSTMKGLCVLGTKELSDTKAQHYIDQISETADQLTSLVSKLGDRTVS